MAQSRDKLTLLTLNAHSWMEPDNEACLSAIAEAAQRENVDVIALQEINQDSCSAIAPQSALTESGYVQSDDRLPIRVDNYALALARRLRQSDVRWQWTWAYAHRGYRVFEEGLAILTRLDVLDTRSLCLSTDQPEGTPRYCRRQTVGTLLRTPVGDRWFYSAHMGWWKDPLDLFAKQWERLAQACEGQPAYLLGDFNNPAHVRGEGYDLMMNGGRWIDCYTRADDKDSGVTVAEQIDGWRSEKVDGMRIDFTFTNQPGATARSRVIFNGAFYPVVSDHFGVLTEEWIS